MTAVPDPAAGTVGRGIAFALLAAFTFAAMDGVAKHLIGTYDVLQVMWIRYIFFMAFGTALAVRQGGGLRQAIRSRRPGLQLLRSLILLFEVAGFLLSFKYLALADAHAIASTAPLFVTALAWPLLGERVGPVRWGAVLVGCAGVLIIIRPGAGVFGWAALIPLVTALTFALYQITTRLLSRVDSPAASMFYMGVVGFVLLTAVAPFVWTPPSAADWALLLLIGTLGCAAHWFLILALQAAPAAIIQPFNYTLIPWAVLVGFVLFGDLPDGWTIAGAALVAASGLFILARERRLQAVSSGS